jgi:hypothetical protein
MVRDGAVAISTASDAVRHAPLEIQANWTMDDVNREGRKIVSGYKKPKSARPLQPAKVAKPNFRYRPMYRGKGKLSAVGGARRQGQPVLLHPLHIEDLFRDRITVGVAVGNLVNFVGRFECKLEDFVAAAERMLAYAPMRDHTDGQENDFAANARKDLDYASTKIDDALRWLNGMREIITRTVQPAIADTAVNEARGR